MALGAAMLFRFVPNTQVRWTHALAGGIFVFWWPSDRQRGCWPGTQAWCRPTTIYGAFATLPILLIWIYLGWVIVLLGAVVAAYMPSLDLQVRWREYRPGWRFVLALELLGELAWRVRRRRAAWRWPRCASACAWTRCRPSRCWRCCSASTGSGCWPRTAGAPCAAGRAGSHASGPAGRAAAAGRRSAAAAAAAAHRPVGTHLADALARPETGLPGAATFRELKSGSVDPDMSREQHPDPAGFVVSSRGDPRPGLAQFSQPACRACGFLFAFPIPRAVRGRKPACAICRSPSREYAFPGRATLVLDR